ELVRGPSSGDGVAQRDRQAQGVWAGDDQHGHGTDGRLVGAADQGPDDGGDDTGGQSEPEQEGGGPIGQRLGTRGGVLSISDHALDSGQARVVVGLFRQYAT